MTGSAQYPPPGPSRLHQVLRDLQISSQSQIDVATLRRLADFTNADTLVYGQYVRAGEQIRIDATVLDLRRDTSTTVKQDVASEKELLTGVDEFFEDRYLPRLAALRCSLDETTVAVGGESAPHREVVLVLVEIAPPQADKFAESKSGEREASERALAERMEAR